MEVSLEEDKTPEQIRSELSNMSFGELQKLKERLGAKVYNEAVFGVTSKKRVPKKTEFKRDNKNRPREMSSKKPVSMIKEIVKTVDKEIRDPRFDAKCGIFNPKGFKRSFDFVQNLRDKELKELKTELEECDDTERKGQIKFLIQRMENQNRENKRNEEKEAKKRNEYAQHSQEIKSGKKPIYMKKSEKNVLDLVEQYEHLKASGSLEKHITKHRKRTAQKDKKKMTVM